MSGRYSQNRGLLDIEKKKSGGRVGRYDGLFVGYVKDNRDSHKTGRLMVWIPEFGADPDDYTSYFMATYVSPFAGSTSVFLNGSNPVPYNETQSSYGFWMIPPDVNTQIIVFFANGDSSRCFWVGCVFDNFMNQQVPGIAAVSSDKHYGPETTGDSCPLPVGEYNKRLDGRDTQLIDERIPETTTTANFNPESIKKPIQPYVAEALKHQGLIFDEIRGTTNSSARREAPSKVFGISTPGPFATTDGREEQPYKFRNPDLGEEKSVITRKGGHQIIFDDHEDHEHIKLRTRSGAEIILDETNGMVYIINARGTAWVELSDSGHIDMWSKNSISMRCEKDINIRADRDINIESGRNISMKAAKDYIENVNEFLRKYIDSQGNRWPDAIENEYKLEYLNDFPEILNDYLTGKKKLLEAFLEALAVGGYPTSPSPRGDSRFSIVDAVPITPGIGYTFNEEVTVVGGISNTPAIFVVNGLSTILSQDQVEFIDGEFPNESFRFTEGTGYNINDIITLEDGSQIRVDSALNGAVINFTIISPSSIPLTTNNSTITQTSVIPTGGSGFSIILSEKNQGIFSVNVREGGDYIELPPEPTITTSNANGINGTFNIQNSIIEEIEGRVTERVEGKGSSLTSVELLALIRGSKIAGETLGDSGNIYIQSIGDMNVSVSNNANITAEDGEFNLFAGQDMRITGGMNLHTLAGTDYYATAGLDVHIGSGLNTNITAGQDFNLTSLVDTKIHFRGDVQVLLEGLKLDIDTQPVHFKQGELGRHVYHDEHHITTIKLQEYNFEVETAKILVKPWDGSPFYPEIAPSYNIIVENSEQHPGQFNVYVPSGSMNFKIDQGNYNVNTSSGGVSLLCNYLAVNAENISLVADTLAGEFTYGFLDNVKVEHALYAGIARTTGGTPLLQGDADIINAESALEAEKSITERLYPTEGEIPKRMLPWPVRADTSGIASIALTPFIYAKANVLPMIKKDGDKKYCLSYHTQIIESIARRFNTHEPCVEHENTGNVELKYPDFARNLRYRLLD